MKKSLILALGLSLFAATAFHVEKAAAYSSNVGADPKNDDPGFGNTGYGDLETKVFVKSATRGKSASISPRRVLAYSSEADGYTLTRQVTQTGAGQGMLACVSMGDVASGDTGYHRCITKGFVRLKYNGATYAIAAGVKACVDQEGVVRGCKKDGTDNVESTANTGIIPLEAKTDAGEYLRAVVNFQ
jgi:hypothetical protein